MGRSCYGVDSWSDTPLRVVRTHANRVGSCCMSTIQPLQQTFQPMLCYRVELLMLELALISYASEPADKSRGCVQPSGSRVARWVESRRPARCPVMLRLRQPSSSSAPKAPGVSPPMTLCG